MNSSFVSHIECETADDLLDRLSPRSKLFGRDYLPHTWIFRGHEEVEYPLLPSALRVPASNRGKRTFLKVLGSWQPVEKSWKNADQIAGELETLLEFFWLADKSGLPIPEDSPATRARFNVLLDHVYSKDDEKIESVIRTWPPNEVLSLMALAQHYGVPTRLLDCTQNAYKAAYFAAVGAVRLHSGDSGDSANRRLSVWALSEQAYDVDRIVSFGGVKRTIEIVTAPRASNPNLHAQEGIFILNRTADTAPMAEVDRAPFDEVIERTFKTFSVERQPFESPLYHFKLPIVQSPRLLRLLAKEGITGATLFPGYRGIAKAVIEQQFWDLR